MSLAGLSLEQEFALLGTVSAGFVSSKYLSLAAFCALLYDHITCLDDEIDFLWTDGWTVSKCLYLMNRYIPPWVFLLQMIYFFDYDLPLSFCTYAIKTVVTLEVLGVFIAEAILVARVYYLWSRSRIIQMFLVGVFAICAIVALGFAGNIVQHLDVTTLPLGFEQGCLASTSPTFWPIFVPTFIVQTLLFVLTVARIAQPLRSGNSNPLLKRLLRDGGLFYFVTVVTVGFTGIGSIDINHPQVSMPALFSIFILAMHSICASHLILSIHSLASDLGSDPTFLLSNLELSRVQQSRFVKQGTNPNELVVEVDAYAPPYRRRADTLEMKTIDLGASSTTTTTTTTVDVSGKVRASMIGKLRNSVAGDELGFRSYTRLAEETVTQ